MTTTRKPVVIQHPGCDVEPMRCGTCEQWALGEKTFDRDIGEDGCYCSKMDGCTVWHNDVHLCWRCRRCGGEVRCD